MDREYENKGVKQQGSSEGGREKREQGNSKEKGGIGLGLGNK